MEFVKPSPPENGIPIIFTISRMNPPTPGHLELIRELIEKALEVNARTVYVILSKSVDNSDNPIVCPSKIDILNEMVAHLKMSMAQQYPQINDIQVEFKCVSPQENSPISTISNMVYQEPQNTSNLDLFLIVGDDRADLLDTMGKLFGKTVHSVGGKILEREEMESYKNLCVNELNELTIREVPISAFSASFVRKLVKNGLVDKFNDVYRPYLSQELIDQLYTEIQEGFKREPSIKRGTKRKMGGKRKATTRKKLKKAKRHTRKGKKRNTRKH
jgi:nicotinic acid mononucleotide adenylyltransferase